MGQRVAVMDSGRVRQCDTPARLYDAPADAFVARFMGSPPMNLLDGRIEAVDGGGLAAVLGTARLPLSSAQAAARPALRSYAGREIAVGVRPDGFEIGPADGRGDLTGVVYLAEMLGSEALIHVELEHVGARITGRFGGRPTAAPGDRVSVAVDPARLDFFDAATGIALDRDGRG